MDSSTDIIDWIKKTLGLSDAQAEGLLFASHWADHQWATSRFGYAKDNAIPPPLQQRLYDRRYVGVLLESLEDVTSPDEEVIARLHLWVSTLPEPED